MSTITEAKPDDLVLRQFRFSRSEKGDLMKIPAGPGLQGFLVINTEQNAYQQIRLLDSNDPATRANCESIWKSIYESNDSILFPEIVDFGIDDDVYFYVSSLPNGEPIIQYIERSAPLPTTAACQLLARFVSRLRFQKKVRTDRFAIPLSSLWFDGASSGPRIIIGDINPRESTHAEAENVAMCQEVIRLLAGDPLDASYTRLCESLEQGPRTLANLEVNLENFLKDTPPTLIFWGSHNEPRQILSPMISSREVEVETEEIAIKPDPTPIAEKPVPTTTVGRLKYLVGAAVITIITCLSINHYYQNQQLKELEILKLEDKSQTSIQLPNDTIITRQASQLAQKIELIPDSFGNPKFLPILPTLDLEPFQIPLPPKSTKAEFVTENIAPRAQITTSEPARTAPERLSLTPVSQSSLDLSIPEYLVATSEEHFPLHLLIKSYQLLGRETSKDPHYIVKFLREAVAMGDAGAMDLLGVCHVRGWGVEIDDPKAVSLFRKAIDLGNLSAYYNLGARYAQGQGVPRNPSAAADLFQIGAEKGHPHCMLVYARCIETGFGRIKSPRRALTWFKKAADSGNLDAVSWCHNQTISDLNQSRY